MKKLKGKGLTPEEKWNIQYNLVKDLKDANGEYLGLTEKEVQEEQKKLQEEGAITQRLILKEGEEEYKIGTWLGRQKVL